MPSCPPRLLLRHWLGLGLLSSTLLCLEPSLGARLGRAAALSTASPNPAQLVQQGIDRYRQGDYPSAIQSLQQALKQYQQVRDQPNTAIVLENLARTYQQLGQSEPAIAHWQQAITLHRQLGNTPQLGRALTEQAQAYTTFGQPKEAIARLCHPMETAAADTDIELIETEHPTPVKCIDRSALALAKTPTDEVAALGSLSEAYRLLGEYDRAIARLEQALPLAKALDNPTYQISVLNSLANVRTSRAQLHYHRAQSAKRRETSNPAAAFAPTVSAQVAQDTAQVAADDTNALGDLQQIAALSQGNPAAQMRALLSTFPIYARQQNQAAIATTLQQALPLLNQLPANRSRVYAALDLARLLSVAAPAPPEPRSSVCVSQSPPATAESLLKQAIATAQQIRDPRAESFALGELGKLYECRGDLATALAWTQQAKFAAAQDAKAQDSLYQWEWQTGRILKAQGQTVAAIAAYEQALTTLKGIRGDILSANRDRQFDFRDTIEPIYRDLIDLRLSADNLATTAGTGQPSTSSPKSTPKNQSKTQTSQPIESDFDSVLKIADSLQLARLQNYFGSECIITAINRDPTAIIDKTEKDQHTAIITSVILEKRTAIVLKLPNQAPRYFIVKRSQKALETTINAYRAKLEDANEAGFERQEAAELYELLIQPFAATLQAQSIKTLVFVQDGLLQSVPMAALYDQQRQKYLVEDYAIATTPSLGLTNLAVRDRSEKSQILALGVTQARTVQGQPFSPLENVRGEIEQVVQKFPGSQALLDDNFATKNLRKVINQKAFSIIHIATHGQFGADPDDTFLVMGDPDGTQNKLTIAGLERLLRRVAKNQNPLDLLMLTACQTGKGDDRAILGLTGVAVQSGVNSAIGSLWFIDDVATAELVNTFYTHLPNTSKAEALQTAQKEFIARKDIYQHPAYWAALVLVGNWH